MSEYTTGQLAKVAQISVRTIQYYDKKGLLKPSQLNDNGNRIYNDTDLNKLKLILLLKSLGLPLKAIGEILSGEHSMTVLNLLLEQQLKYLHAQTKTTKKQIRMIEKIRRNLPQVDQIKINDLNDVEKAMNNKKSLRRVHINMVAIGLLMDVIEISTLIWAILKGNWLPFIIAIVIAIGLAVWITRYYFQKVNYVCPNCNTEFKPKFWAAFWGRHNIRARYLVCPACGQKNYCVEVYDDNSK